MRVWPSARPPCCGQRWPRRVGRALLADADAILARQLETLVLAALARRLHAPSVPLIFECLDIHRQMGSPGTVGRGLRIGRAASSLAQCQGLMVSSPHFVTHHFAQVHKRLPPVTLIENKVLSFEVDRSLLAEQAGGPPAARPALAHRVVRHHTLRA